MAITDGGTEAQTLLTLSQNLVTQMVSLRGTLEASFKRTEEQSSIRKERATLMDLPSNVLDEIILNMTHSSRLLADLQEFVQVNIIEKL